MTFNHETTSEQIAEAFGSQIKGKVVLVTGATWGGIGADNARVIAASGAKLVIITGRSQAKLDETIENIQKQTPNAIVRGLILDLSSFKSVRKAAEEVNAYAEDIDVLINNAGVMACPYSKTEDGFEMQFGTNHLGHFLFTNLILKKLLATPHPRVVNVSSLGHGLAPIIFGDIGFSDGAKYDKNHAYGQSKTANILFTRELHRRYNKEHGLVAFSIHPGAILDTNLARHMDINNDYANIEVPKDYWGTGDFAQNMSTLKMKNVSQGGATTLAAAFNPEIASQSGAYLDDCEIHEEHCRNHAKQSNDAFKLWTVSEELVGQKFD
ncbi:Env9p [Sugiyamaella lignohabitans]|uniref:Env9p n=1 Tax=Sugiyamaella lignohabitans TaxID=796027 RepID=A0A167ERJ6_9ASCO|nr:Env9p [Sugiyamaella lignohabitans]ANB14388.1 Env9p [Sugiyamaella lignohabitans]